MAGIVKSGIETMFDLADVFNGKIYDSTTGEYLEPTVDSLNSADVALMEAVDAAVDLFPLPLEVDVLGIMQISVDETKMRSFMQKMLSVVKTYGKAVNRLP